MQYMIVGNPKRKRNSKRRRRAPAVHLVSKRSHRARRRRHHNPSPMRGKIGGLDVMAALVGAGGAVAAGMAGSAIADAMNVSVVNAKTPEEVQGAKLGRLGIRAGLILGAGILGSMFKPTRRLIGPAAVGAGVVLLFDAVRAFAPQLQLGDDEMSVLPEHVAGVAGYVTDPRLTSRLNGVGNLNMLEPLYG